MRRLEGFFDTAGGIFCMRVGIAVLCGGLVGLERTLRAKDAGIRTYTILAAASALLMFLSKYGFCDLAAGLEVGGTDNSMIAHQMVNGIGFLCAGVIFKSKGDALHGLTTACYIWGVCAIGMACGCGMVGEAVFTTLLLLGLMQILRRFNLGENAYHYQTLEITYLPNPVIMDMLERKRKRYGIHICQSEFIRNDNGTVTLRMQVRMKKEIQFERALRFLDQNEMVHAINS
ncbi:MAG: MgtC/SapB family protein [Clostridia bacterium]|nr:MgtC/SapB family protein [Clostridia bacterium]